MNEFTSTTNSSATWPPVTAESIRAAMQKTRDAIISSAGQTFTPNPKLPLTGRTLDGSLPVCRDKRLVKTRKPPTRRRRRLWRHWLATREVPDPNVYVIASRFVVGHPDTIARMAEAIHRLNNREPAPDSMHFEAMP